MKHKVAIWRIIISIVSFLCPTDTQVRSGLVLVFRPHFLWLVVGLFHLVFECKMFTFFRIPCRSSLCWWLAKSLTDGYFSVFKFVVVLWHVWSSGFIGAQCTSVNRRVTRGQCRLYSLLSKALSWQCGPSGWGLESELWHPDRPQNLQLPGRPPSRTCWETFLRATQRLH